MRFFILFTLCLFTYSQAAAVEVTSSKSELQEMGIEIQLLSSIEGLPSCKIGGEINADIGKWLRLVRDGEAFAQTCVYEDWNISLTQTSGLSFYQVESSQDGKKLLSLLSDQGTTLHIFHTSGPGLKEYRPLDGKLLFLWEDENGYSYETLVGKNEIHTSSEAIGEHHWTDLRLEEMEYLGLDGKGQALIGYGHLFRTRDGQVLDLVGHCFGGDSNEQCWHWLKSFQNKPLRILWGEFAFGAGGGPSLYEAMPGLAEVAGAAPHYSNERFGFSLSWLPGNYNVLEADNGDGVTVRDNKGFTMLAYGTYGYMVMGQKMEDVLIELSHGLDVTYRRINDEKSWFVVSGFAGEDIVYIKCFLRNDAACIVRMSYPKHKAEFYAPQVEKVMQSFRFN